VFSQTTQAFGLFMLGIVEYFGGTATMLTGCAKEFFSGKFYFKLTLQQIYQIGVRSLSLVLAAALSTGMVMSLQFGLGLEKFGGKLYVPKIVSLSILRELGPVFTGLMVAGRVGAGIASEIGSMVVTQQIDAIRALGTSPVRMIIIPRIVALVIALPILTILADVVGIFGALIVGVYELKLDPHFFLQKVFATNTIADFGVGVLKTVFFGFAIGVTGCFYGFRVGRGTQGVGIATTQAVVVSSILIVVSDFFLTKLFWILFE